MSTQVNPNAVGLPCERGPVPNVPKQYEEWDQMANQKSHRRPPQPTTPFASGMPERNPASPSAEGTS